ncbi:MAG: dipeptidase PepE [Owenweeksia sp.]
MDLKKMELLIVSTSKIHGSAYMTYLLDEVNDFFKTDEIVFIPYARPSGISYDAYTEAPRKAFAEIGIKVKGIHEFDDPAEALRQAKGIFTGGGNTFLLLKTLYEKDLVHVLREVAGRGTPYMGSSAGSNITGLTVGTTNDMPIVYPPSFDALQFVPFNINPHYLDPDPGSKHQGETRETRIKEFHHFNKQVVIGIREGSWLRLHQGKLQLKGAHTARLFEAGKEAREVEPGDVSFLL